MSRAMWILVIGLLVVVGTVVLIVAEDRTNFLAKIFLESPGLQTDASTPENSYQPNDPRYEAASAWLASNSYGEIRAMNPAPDWEKGARAEVTTDTGKRLLFYFAGDKLCGVWAVDPREKLFNDESC